MSNVAHPTPKFSLRNDEVCLHPNRCRHVELVHQPNSLGLLHVPINFEIRFDDDVASPKTRSCLPLEICDPDFQAFFVVENVQHLLPRRQGKDGLSSRPVERAESMTTRRRLHKHQGTIISHDSSQQSDGRIGLHGYSRLPQFPLLPRVPGGGQHGHPIGVFISEGLLNKTLGSLHHVLGEDGWAVVDVVGGSREVVGVRCHCS